MMLRKTIFFITVLSHQFVFSSQADSLLNLIRQSENSLEQSELYLKLGDVYEYTEPPQALIYYQKAYETAHSVSLSSSQRTLSPEADLLRAKSLRYIGILHSTQGDYDEALENYFASIEILDNLKNLYTSPFRNDIINKIAKLYSNIGVVYSRQGVFGIAKEYYLQAVTVNEELNDSIGLAVTYSSLGIVDARMANLPGALEFFQKALDIYTLHGRKEGMAQSYNNIGGIHYQMSNWSEALKLYMQAHNMYSEMGQVHRIAAIKGNIGMVYQQMEEYNKARGFQQQSLDLRLEVNDKSGIVESYNNIGGLYAALNDHAAANEYYIKSYQMATEIGDQRMIALSLVSIGKGYFDINQISNAISNTIKGLEVAREHDLKFIEQSAIKNLSAFYAASSDFRRAYEYANDLYAISQEILDEQKARQINELEIEYKAREKQQRIEWLEQESELSHVKLKQSRTITLVLSLLILTGLIITVFTLILIRQRNKIFMLKKENEAEKAIKKTDNDLKAILKTHAHAMILFDNELNVMAFNTKANQWVEKYLGLSLNDIESFSLIENPFLKNLVADTLQESMKGFSMEKEKEIVHENDKYYFKFFCNPVFEDSDQIIQSVSLMIENVTERRNTREKILSDLKEKETLIKEIHHRVKNNMQVIMSLIRMQSRQFRDDSQIESFRELEQRIAAMSYVHEDLYKSENLSDIKFDDYLRKISSNLSGVYGRNVKILNHIEMNNYFVDIDLAMPCGLVVNELISNSLKHAFVGKKATLSKDKKIEVSFVETPKNYELKVVDNGIGIDENIDPQKTKSMGLHLIKIIVEEQLRGSWKLQSNGGLTVIVEFPKPSKNP